MSRPKVLITRRDVPESAIKILKEECDAEVFDEVHPIPKEELIKRMPGKNGLFCLLTDPIDSEVIDAAGSDLKVISTMSVGYEHIDLKHCKINGKWIYQWSPMWLCGQGLAGSTVGIVAEELGAKYVEFEELIKHSDFIVSMCNLSDETRNLFCQKVFEMMKPTAVFINTSRGGVVNQKDLYDALKRNTIRAAAIDVTIPEPLPRDHELLTLPNLSIYFFKIFNFILCLLAKKCNRFIEELPTQFSGVVTPHVASAETNVRIKMADLTAENILLGLKGKDLKTPVPMPK
ncbi:hypothetical protein TNCV_525151 [Trichonephila clavipes]|nr:hypothetical protein TNCV_525151 [Trichonephila clavipes]